MSQTPHELGPDDPHGSPSTRPHDPEMRGVRGPYYAAVRDAWAAAHSRLDRSGALLELALRAYARDGRARGVPVSALLIGLDRLTRAESDNAAPDAESFRELAGTIVIRAYYRDG